jgi:mono/diheme cytochrome c family protein
LSPQARIATVIAAGKNKKKDGGETMLKVASVIAGALIAGTASAAAQQSLLDRGRYLVDGIGVCVNCHTPRGKDGHLDKSKYLAGGTQNFRGSSYSVFGSNLTPDAETGLGKWSESDIKRAITEGRRPNGVQLAPNMRYMLYRIMTPRDLDATVAYLRSLPPNRNEVPAPQYKAEHVFTPYPPAAKPWSEADLTDPIKRGHYLAAVGHCLDCHTRPAGEGLLDYANGLGAGGRAFGPKKVVAANITSHKTKGIGGWSNAEIKKTLTTGVSRDGRKLDAPMVEFAENYRLMTDADLDAVIAWMRSLPPIE